MKQNPGLISFSQESLPQILPNRFDEIIKNKALFFSIAWTRVFRAQAGIPCSTPHIYKYTKDNVFAAKAYCEQYYPQEDFLDKLAWLQKYHNEDLTNTLNTQQCVEALQSYPRSLDFEALLASMFLAKDTIHSLDTIRDAVFSRLAKAADRCDISEVIEIMLYFGPIFPDILSFKFSPLFSKDTFDVLPLSGDKAYKIDEVKKSTALSEETKQGLITFLESYKGDLSDNLFYLKQIVTNTYWPLLKDNLFSLKVNTAQEITKSIEDDHR